MAALWPQKSLPMNNWLCNLQFSGIITFGRYVKLAPYVDWIAANIQFPGFVGLVSKSYYFDPIAIVD